MQHQRSQALRSQPAAAPQGRSRTRSMVSGARRGLPTLPCMLLVAGVALFFVTLVGSQPPLAEEPASALAFAGAPTRPRLQRFLAPRDESDVMRRISMEEFEARRKNKRTALDRGTDKWAAQSEKARSALEFEWNLLDGRNMESTITDRVIDASEKAAAKAASQKKEGGFSMPSFELPGFGASAPAPAAAPAPAPSRAAQGSGDSGNPFAFLTELFQGTTTTTTTTTQPPNPIEAFFSSFR
mmetsp:Transcript_27949/g.77246  ORF Transcript_27949/g.77246 Transcript_27949/m.77246 type:complete len:241 (+) Transcript_27949:130-852(+)